MARGSWLPSRIRPVKDVDGLIEIVDKPRFSRLLEGVEQGVVRFSGEAVRVQCLQPVGGGLDFVNGDMEAGGEQAIGAPGLQFLIGAGGALHGARH